VSDEGKQIKIIEDKVAENIKKASDDILANTNEKTNIDTTIRNLLNPDAVEGGVLAGHRTTLRGSGAGSAMHLRAAKNTLASNRVTGGTFDFNNQQVCPVHNAFFVNSVKEYVNCVAGPSNTLFAFNSMTNANNETNQREVLFKLTSAAATNESPGNIYGFLAHLILTLSLSISKTSDLEPQASVTKFANIPDKRPTDDVNSWTPEIYDAMTHTRYTAIYANPGRNQYDYYTFKESYITAARAVTEYVNHYDYILYNHIDVENHDIHKSKNGVEDVNMPELENYHKYYYKQLQKQIYTGTNTNKTFEILKMSTYLQHYNYKNYDPQYMEPPKECLFDEFNSITDPNLSSNVNDLQVIKSKMLNYITANTYYNIEFFHKILNNLSTQTGPPSRPENSRTGYVPADILLLMPLPIKKLIDEPIEYYEFDKNISEEFDYDKEKTKFVEWFGGFRSITTQRLRPLYLEPSRIVPSFINTYDTEIESESIFSEWNKLFDANNLTSFKNIYLKFDLYIKSTLQFVYTLNNYLLSIDIKYTSCASDGSELLHVPTHWRSIVGTNVTRLGEPCVYAPRVDMVKLFDIPEKCQKDITSLFQNKLQTTANSVASRAITANSIASKTNSANFLYNTYKDIIKCILQDAPTKTNMIYEIIEFKQKYMCHALYHFDSKLFPYLCDYDKKIIVKLITLGKIEVIAKTTRSETKMAQTIRYTRAKNAIWGYKKIEEAAQASRDFVNERWKGTKAVVAGTMDQFLIHPYNELTKGSIIYFLADLTLLGQLWRLGGWLRKNSSRIGLGRYDWEKIQQKILDESKQSANTTIDLTAFEKSVRTTNIEYIQFQSDYLQKALLFRPSNKYIPRITELVSLPNYIEFATLLTHNYESPQALLKQINAIAVINDAIYRPIGLHTKSYNKYNLAYFDTVKKDYDKFNASFVDADKNIKGGTNSTKTHKINLKRNNKTRKMKHEELVVQ
jgi:hypothetical protein